MLDRKKYYQQHKEKYKEYQKRYYSAHLENEHKRSKEYYYQHKDEQKGRRKEYQKKYREQHRKEQNKYARDYYRNGYGIKRKHGISMAELNKMVENQNGACLICDIPFSTLPKKVIDHDHNSGKIRGILCNKCNLLLGHAKDSIQILKAAIKYLGG